MLFLVCVGVYRSEGISLSIGLVDCEFCFGLFWFYILVWAKFFSMVLYCEYLFERYYIGFL